MAHFRGSSCGREDVYMTLYVLAGFADAKRYGVDIPENVVKKALQYVTGEIAKRLKPEERDIALILYAAYVVTSYPKTYPGNEQGYMFAQKLDRLCRHTFRCHDTLRQSACRTCPLASR